MGSPLIWIDLEMTGLDPDRCRILEIAVLATDSELKLIPGEYHAVIKAPPAALRNLKPQVREMHTRSGLLERVKGSRNSLATVERGALEFIKARASKGEGILSGNSIHVDRRFLLRHMPRVASYLHYRLVDVSTIKELVRRWYPSLPHFPKADSHTAMADIRESIAELTYYRERVFVPAAPPP